MPMEFHPPSGGLQVPAEKVNRASLLRPCRPSHFGQQSTFLGAEQSRRQTRARGRRGEDTAPQGRPAQPPLPPAHQAKGTLQAPKEADRGPPETLLLGVKGLVLERATGPAPWAAPG